MGTNIIGGGLIVMRAERSPPVVGRAAQEATGRLIRIRHVANTTFLYGLKNPPVTMKVMVPGTGLEVELVLTVSVVPKRSLHLSKAVPPIRGGDPAAQFPVGVQQTWLVTVKLG